MAGAAWVRGCQCPLQLQQLPEGILGASVSTDRSCGIYWAEAIGRQLETAAEEEIVGQIGQVLETWSEDNNALTVGNFS